MPAEAVGQLGGLEELFLVHLAYGHVPFAAGLNNTFQEKQFTGTKQGRDLSQGHQLCIIIFDRIVVKAVGEAGAVRGQKAVITAITGNQQIEAAGLFQVAQGLQGTGPPVAPAGFLLFDGVQSSHPVEGRFPVPVPQGREGVMGEHAIVGDDRCQRLEKVLGLLVFALCQAIDQAALDPVVVLGLKIIVAADIQPDLCGFQYIFAGHAADPVNDDPANNLRSIIGIQLIGL